MILEGNIVDIHNKRIFKGRVTIKNNEIVEIKEEYVSSDTFILPGFVDSHIHIESSMLIPSRFAHIAVNHGTISTVSDPHEIANVLGVEGVLFMLDNAKDVPLKFNFGAPSCVPATSFETAGAHLDAEDIRMLMNREDIKYLTEMMNYPGVLYKDEEVMQKLTIARDLNKPIDGHAPGLDNDQVVTYINAGISTDHECFTYEEAEWKIKNGMKILIREGSAAKNFEALIPLIDKYPEYIMLCSDDKHPDDLVEGHINLLVKRAIAEGYNLYNVLRSTSINPVEHYNLDMGLLRVGDKADLIEVNNLKDFNVIKTIIDGNLVSENGKSLFDVNTYSPINNFECSEKELKDFIISSKAKNIKVIKALEGELITKLILAKPREISGNIVSDTENDILKFSVVNRYFDAPVASAFINGFGLKKGAIASSVGHDSHNILAVGVDDDSLKRAVNLVIKNKGAVVAVDGDIELVLPLPFAGLMCDDPAEIIGKKYEKIDKYVKSKMGSLLHAPFMTLSFMALLVIPSLKLSDKGLFDGDKFEFTDLGE